MLSYSDRYYSKESDNYGRDIQFGTPGAADKYPKTKTRQFNAFQTLHNNNTSLRLINIFFICIKDYNFF